MSKEQEWNEKYGDIDPHKDDPDELRKDATYDFDSRNIRYNIYAGSTTPTQGRCNALLTSWEERYGEPRYCTRIATKWYEKSDDDSDFCYQHTNVEGLMQHAREVMSHGLFTKSVAHFFDKSDPVEKIFIVGLFENLIDESIYDFEVEQDDITLDFDKSDFEPENVGVEVDEDNEATIAFPQPNAHEVRALALLEASVDEIKMLKANSDIFEDNMRSESATKVATTDDGRIGETYDENQEHYLNLAYSRLVKDHKENLKRGGVDIEGVEMQDDGGEVKKAKFTQDLPTKDDAMSPEVENEDTVNTVKIVDDDQIQSSED